MSDVKQTKIKKEGGKIVFAVCIAVIVVLSGVIVFLLVQNAGNNKAEEATPQRDVVVNEDNVGEIVTQMEEETAKTDVPATYQVAMNSTWIFSDGKAASENAYVENSEANSNDVYFDVLLSGTDETIYESPILPVGTHLDDISLKKEMEAGSYDCVLIYHLLDEEGNELTTVRMGLTIVIEN